MNKLASLALTALLALSGIASATYHISIPTGGDFYAGNYRFKFAVSDEDAVSTKASNPTVLAAYWGEKAFSPDAGLYTIRRADGALKLTVGRGTLADFSKPSKGCTYANSTTFSTELEPDTIYTLSVEGKGQNVGGQTVTLSQGNKQLETISYRGNLNGGNAYSDITTWFNQDFDAAKASSGSSAFVRYALGAAALLALFWLLMRFKKK